MWLVLYMQVRPLPASYTLPCKQAHVHRAVGRVIHLLLVPASLPCSLPSPPFLPPWVS
jgi:hypothetical protein